MRIKMSIWIALALVGLGTHEIIDELIRPRYGVGEGLLPYILGIAPNFLAAGLIFPFSILTIRDSYADRKGSILHLNKWFWLGVAVSQIALIAWEFIQLSGNLVFDPDDIIATLLGGLFAVVVYYLTRGKYLDKVKKDQQI